MYNFKFQKWDHADNINISIKSPLDIRQNKNLICNRKAFCGKLFIFYFNLVGI